MSLCKSFCRAAGVYEVPARSRALLGKSFVRPARTFRIWSARVVLFLSELVMTITSFPEAATTPGRGPPCADSFASLLLGLSTQGEKAVHGGGEDRRHAQGMARSRSRSRARARARTRARARARAR